MTELQNYKTILKHAWYVDRFNHKELAHTYLANSYSKGIRVLDANYNTSFIVQGLKWTAHVLWEKNKIKEPLYRMFIPTTVNNEADEIIDLHFINKELDDEQRFILKQYMDGYTPTEIGQVLNKSRQNISNKLNRIWQKI